MISDCIHNACLRFLVAYDKLNVETRNRMAKEAFLSAISMPDINHVERENLLSTIRRLNPEVTSFLVDEKILKSFYDLLGEKQRRREFVSGEEMHWVANFVQSVEIRNQIEEGIYYSQLILPSRFNLPRRQFGWGISEDRIRELVREAIRDESVSLERKIEIAQEFDEPFDALKREYYSSLILDKKSHDLQYLGDDMNDVVMSVAIHLVDHARFDYAIEVIRKFMPDRTDMISEIMGIKAIFESSKNEAC